MTVFETEVTIVKHSGLELGVEQKASIHAPVEARHAMPSLQCEDSHGMDKERLTTSRLPGNSNSPTRHAELFSQARKVGPLQPQRLLNQLQRNHGNRYVLRMLDIARQNQGEPEEEEESIQARLQRCSEKGGGVKVSSRPVTFDTRLRRRSKAVGNVVQREPVRPPRLPVIVPRVSIAVISQRITRAMDHLERYAGAGTFAPWVVPLLRRLTSMITYRDGEGRDHGGGELEVGFRRRRRPFFLRLVLDDEPSPHSRGYFQPNGDRGSIGLNRRALRGGGEEPAAAEGSGLMSLSEADLGQIIYHEAIHMFRYWLRHVGAAHLPFSRAERTVLNLGLFRGPRGEIALIERNLATVITDVNRSRGATAGVRPVAATAAHRFAESLSEEAMVRGETRYMTTLSQRREAQTRGYQLGLMEDAGRSFGEEAADYLFESGDMLSVRDRTALRRNGREAFARIRRLLGEIAHRHLRARWGARPTETGLTGRL